jgi:hypothetical protein
LIFVVVSIVVLTSVGIALPDGFTQVVILGKMAIKFLEPVNMNNQPIVNTSQICFSDGTCMNSTASFGSKYPYDSYVIDLKQVVNESVYWDFSGTINNTEDGIYTMDISDENVVF